jgi:ATP-dependent helicase/nuclease subunit B
MKNIINFMNDKGTIVLVPNARVQKEVNQLNAATSINTKPNVYTKGEWYKKLFSETQRSSLNPTNLLTHAQSKFLWEALFREKEIDYQAPITPLLRKAQNSYRLYLSYLLSNYEDTLKLHDESLEFLEWIKLIEERTTNLNSIMPDQLEFWISQQINNLTLPSKVVIYGEYEESPLFKSILGTFTEKSIEVVTLEHSVTESVINIISTCTIENELTAAAYWAKEISSKEPDASIAVLLPGVDTYKDKAKSVFESVLAIDTKWPGKPIKEDVFNIGSSYWLSGQGLTKAILQILKAGIRPHDIDFWCSFICSRYIKGHKQFVSGRHSFAMNLKNQKLSKFSLKSIIGIATHYCKGDSGLIETLNALNLCAKEKATPFEWTTRFTSTLNECGIPGDHALNPEEVETFKQFEKVLLEFRSLGLLAEKFTANQAMAALETVIQSAVYQKHNFHSNINIMDVKEAPNYAVDYIWVIGCNQDRWPSLPTPAKLLPQSILKEVGVIGASVDANIEYANSLFKKISTLSKNITISYSEHSEENKLVPNFCLETLEGDITELPELEILKMDETISQFYEKVPFDNVPMNGSDDLKGGTSFFDDQSKCPARAFAKHRLRLQEPQSQRWGIDPRDRSNVLHLVLKSFWDEVKTSKKLNTLDNDEIKIMFLSSWDTNLKEYLDWKISFLSKAMLSVERHKASTLFMKQIELEKQRPPFEVVATERKDTVKIGRFYVNIILDREDKDIQSNGVIALDNKRYEGSIKSWLRPRTGDVQLPIYVTSNKDVNYIGAGFNSLHGSKAQFTGISDEVDFPKEADFKAVSKCKNKIANTWDGLKEYWNQSINMLAVEIDDGIITPEPTEKNNCTFCAMQSICGIRSIAN